MPRSDWERVKDTRRKKEDVRLSAQTRDPRYLETSPVALPPTYHTASCAASLSSSLSWRSIGTSIGHVCLEERTGGPSKSGRSGTK
jgi:hypothetical protein